jgi:MFS family permease
MPVIKNAKPWLPTVLRLGWVSFFADVASEMAYPIIPLFIVNALGAPKAALGFVEGFAEAIVSFMKGWSGFHSDHTGKRVPYIRWGYGLSALGKPLLALAPSWLGALVARSADRFGKGLRTTSRDAMIADAVPKEDLGRAYGIHRTMDTAGAFLGVAIVVVILFFLGQKIGAETDSSIYRTIFACAAIPGLFSVLITFSLKDKKRKPEELHETVQHSKVALKSFPRGYWRALVLTTVFAVANSSDTFLLLRASEFKLALYQVILAYLLYNLTYTLLSYPMGVWSDKIGRWAIVAAGWAIYAGVYIGFAQATSAVWLWPLFACYGIYMGFTDGVTKALVAGHAPRESKGTALGLFYMVSGFATLLGCFLTGLLYDQFGARIAFLTCAAIAVVALLGIPLTRKFESVEPSRVG